MGTIGKTKTVALDFVDRDLLRQAARRYIDAFAQQRCQHCGRPDKEEEKAQKDRDRNKELALLARLERLLDTDLVNDWQEANGGTMAERYDAFLSGAKEAQDAKRVVAFSPSTGDGNPPQFRMYKDEDGKRIHLPKLSDAEKRGEDKLKELKVFEVVLPEAVHLFAVKSLEKMDLWMSAGAKEITTLNEKFGVGLLGKDAELPEKDVE
jgi:hypothetical protein